MTIEATENTTPTPTPSGDAVPGPRIQRTYVDWTALQPGDSIISCNDVLWVDRRTVISAAPAHEGLFVLRTNDEDGTEVPAGGGLYAMHSKWLVERNRGAGEPRSNLEQHAERELRAAGLLSKESDYEGMIGTAVLGLVRELSTQDHSGYSGRLTLDVFNTVARFKPLSSITNDPSEWMQISPDMIPGGEPATWQNRRSSSCFSNDGGKTYYDIDADDHRAIRTARTPGEPEPEPELAVTASPDPMARDQAIAIAQQCAKAKPQSYYAEPFTPHEWVIDAIMMAANGTPGARVSDQPPPTPNGERPIWETIIEMCERWAGDHPIDRVVIDDMKERDKLGRARYGTALQPKNGRNQLVDAYQEQLDLIAYLGNEIAEQGLPIDSLNHPLGDMLWRQIANATTIRTMITERATSTDAPAA